MFQVPGCFWPNVPWSLSFWWKYPVPGCFGVDVPCSRLFLGQCSLFPGTPFGGSLDSSALHLLIQSLRMCFLKPSWPSWPRIGQIDPFDQEIIPPQLLLLRGKVKELFCPWWHWCWKHNFSPSTCCISGHLFRASYPSLPGGEILENQTPIIISKGILLLNSDKWWRGKNLDFCRIF